MKSELTDDWGPHVHMTFLAKSSKNVSVSREADQLPPVLLSQKHSPPPPIHYGLNFLPMPRLAYCLLLLPGLSLKAGPGTTQPCPLSGHAPPMPWVDHGVEYKMPVSAVQPNRPTLYEHIFYLLLCSLCSEIMHDSLSEQLTQV